MTCPRSRRFQLHGRKDAKGTGMAGYQVLLSNSLLSSRKLAVNAGVDCIRTVMLESFNH
jgi:hypothetical protein